MKTFITLLASTLLMSCIFGQVNLAAKRINTKIDVDGKLSEGIWNEADQTSQFITWQPTPGLKPNLNSEVKVLYDDEAIYIGAVMHVPSRDSIMTELTQRDDVGNTDFFGIFLDTYGNGTDAFEFIVSATGVQFDAKLSRRGEDNNWDAVWFSAVDLKDKQWSEELKIPYSAIRFSKTDVQNWKMNFIRRVASTGDRKSIV